MRHLRYSSLLIIFCLVGQIFALNWLFLSSKIPEAKAASPWADHLVISELATGGPDSFADEFVELYNPTPDPINIGGIQIEYRNSLDALVFNISIPGSPIIPGFGFYLIASPVSAGYSGPTSANLTVNPALNFYSGGGHFVIRDSGGNEIDRVGWGSANNPEGGLAAPAQGTGNNKSIERKPGELDQLHGNGVDTDVNANDFLLLDNRDPQRTSSPVEPIAVDSLNIYVDDSNAGFENGSESFPFNTMAEGITALSAGGTVHVKAGTYSESVLIDKLLTLQSEDGIGAAIINSGSDGITVTASSVTINGFEIANHQKGINLTDVDYVTISNNIIHDNNYGLWQWNGHHNQILNNQIFNHKDDDAGQAGIGISLLGPNGDNLIQGNQVYGNDQQGIFLGYPSTGYLTAGNTISGNTIYDNGQLWATWGDEFGIHLSYAQQNIISGNDIYGHNQWWFGAGLYLFESPNNQVVNNNGGFHQNTSGVNLEGSSSGNIISGNLIEDNQYGVRVLSENSIFGTAINNNDIVNNPTFGVQNIGLSMLNAQNNWWGDNTGPFHPGLNPSGLGNPVSDNVSFMPFITKDLTPPTIVDFNVEPIDVNVGWNLIITATVTDDLSGVAAVSADFAYNEEFTNRPSPSSVAMGNIGGNNWRVDFTVPAWGTEIFVKVAARDNADNYIRSTETKSFVLHPHTWQVDDDLVECPDALSQTIQGAIDSVRVLPGDTIVVCDGAYNENILLNKAVHLKSKNGAAVTVIDGTGLPGNGLTALGIDGVEINGFTIASTTAAGILLQDSSKLNVSQNRVHHHVNGIKLQNSDKNTFSHNRVYQNEMNGIVAWDTNPAQTSDENEIRHNDIYDNGRVGLLVGTSGGFANQGWRIAYNDVINSGWNGIELTNSQDGEIRNNEIKQSVTYYGILISSFGGTAAGSHRVERNKVETSGKSGIYLIAYDGGTLANNQLRRNESKKNSESGLVLEGTNSNRLEDNEVKENSQGGILLTGSNNNLVRSNRAEKNGQYGISLTSNSSNNSIERNRNRNNSFFDVFWDSTGAGNVPKRNSFKTSSPPGWWK